MILRIMETVMGQRATSLVILGVFLAGGLALVPAAEACTVSQDPVGTACIQTFEHQFGDPSCEQPGYHYGSTFGYIDLAGRAWVGFAGDGSCYNTGHSERETQQLRFDVAVWGVAVVDIDHTDHRATSGSFCTTQARIFTDPTGDVGHALPCRHGTVPQLPWGDMAP